MRKPAVFFIAVVLGIGFDLLTKKLAFDALSERQIFVLIPDVLVFVHAENHGVAFSLFANHPWFILAVTSAAICFLAWLYFKTRATARGAAIAAMALLLTGAAGNLIDRLFLGYVRDFIDFVPRIPLIGHWAVFNAADICITVGVALYAITEMFAPPPDSKSPDTTNHAAADIPPV